MSAETHCPQCQRPLPATVISGPAQAVVRCEGCSALLLWSNGRVVRAAKPSGNAPPPRQTVQGMAIAPPPRPAEPVKTPEPPPKMEEPKTNIKLQPLTPGAASSDDDEDDVTRIDGVDPSEPPLASLKPEGNEYSQRGPTLARIETKKEPARTVLGMPSPVAPAGLTPKKDQSAPISVKGSQSGKIELGKAPAVVSRKDPSVPISVKGSQSGKIELGKAPAVVPKKDASAPNAVKKEATGPVPKVDAPKADAAKSKEGTKPQVVAAVADVKTDAAGPMVNPTEWFVDQPTTGKGQTVPRSEETGPVALPPPPGRMDSAPVLLPSSPFSNESTPPLGIKLPPAAAAPATAAPAAPPVAASAPPPAAPPPAAAPPVAASAPPPPAPTPPAAAPASPSPPANRPVTLMGLPTNAPVASSPPPSTPGAAPPRMTEPMGAVKPTPPAAAEKEAEDDELPPLDEPKHATIRMGAAAPQPPAAPPAASPPPSASAVPPPSPGKGTPDWVVDVPSEPAALPPAPRTPTLGTPRLEETARARRSGGDNKKLIIWAGGGVGALLLVGGLVFALTRSSGPEVKPPRPPEPEKVAVKPPEPTPTPPPPKPPEPEKVAATPEPQPERVAANPSPDEPARPKGKTLGGKKVVLEYDPKPTAPEPPPATAPVPAGEDPNTLARAREAYHKGNQKLFSGDTDGAVSMYRESLRIYPGYVAGYRGLGLAYAEQNNVNDAMTAFKKYIGTVPNARDVPLIKKRMDHLLGKTSSVVP